MWKAAEESNKLAIELDKKRTTARINAETDLLVEEVKMKVDGKDMKDMKVTLGTYLKSRTKQFSKAVANRHEQVLADEARKFVALKTHQGNLMDGLMKEITGHGYEVAKKTVAVESNAAGKDFKSNEKVQGALKQVSKAGDEWAKTFHTSEGAAKQGFASWSSAYNSLEGPWNNVTGTFKRTNKAVLAARGTGPDARWATELVRVAGELAQTSRVQASRDAPETVLALVMAKKAAGVVKANSGSIVTLDKMLDEAEAQADQASSLVNLRSSTPSRPSRPSR